MDLKTWRARPAYLVARDPIEIPFAGTRIGEIWTEGYGSDHAILMIADTPEIRQKLASVGIYVNAERELEAVA